MLKKSFFRYLTVCLCLLPMSPGISAELAGKVLRAKGEVVAERADGKKDPLEKRSKVYVGDKIQTGSSGQVLIQLEDKSRLIVRKKSEVKISAFQYEEKETDKVETSLISGALRAVSGKIAKANPASSKYSAGTATIGIRGTDIEVAFVGDGQKDRAGIYNYVYDGATHMKLASGEEADIAKEKSGFVPKDLKPGEARLQVLDTRPAFIQGSGFDTLIQQLTNPRLPSFR
jgi:hypothetical protein